MREDRHGVGDASFDMRVEAISDRLTPAERRVAAFFVEHKQEVLLSSAAQIATLTSTSDATVVRTAKSLGFESLTGLREVVLSEVTGSASPSRRLARTLDAAGDDTAAALRHVVELHEDVLSALRDEAVIEGFGRAVHLLGSAERRHVFGIGPSGSMADYATLQFNRIGLPTLSISTPGVGLADCLLWIGKHDAILAMAYAPLYREISIVLDEAQRKGAPVILISDSLGPIVGNKATVVLAVPRGRADHLAMHGGTVVLIEALIIALAGKHRETAIASLERFSLLRGSIDKDWTKRGLNKKNRVIK